MKRKLTYYRKNLMLFDRNHEWLTSDVELKYKIMFYPRIWQTYGLMPFTAVRSIQYLGKKFAFDNPATPLNLQNYPHEITTKILSNMDITPRTILDIGGNVGQFSVTMKYILNNKAIIDIFEPNKVIFPILEKNIAGIDGLKAYNFAIGPSDQSAKMYYEPGRSGTGSLVRENASDAPESISELEIDMVNSVNRLTKRKHYDLIKIDVEGFEIEVISTLTDVTTKYLFIEMSNDRGRSYIHSQIFDKIKILFGDFDIAYSSPITKQTNTFDVLLKIRSSVDGVRKGTSR